LIRVALDVDGTLADTMAIWLDNFNKNQNGKFKKRLTSDDISHWNFWMALGLDVSEFYKTLSDCWSLRWAEVPLVENDAPSSIDKLRSIAKVDIVTARDGLTHKFVKKWLAEKNIFYDSYVGVGGGIDKARLDYDFFIDDSPENALEIVSMQKRLLLYDQPWNKHIRHPKISRISKIHDAIREIENSIL